ncbi:MAG: hypothetical protein ACTHW1_07615 [Ancrocorticia sp.]|uniref:hypothetical protein n=1 Tax=Ancrocorticia sp. TaxID=2593684 RepID=UPI003F8DEAB8
MQRSGERGNMLILGIGIWTVVCALLVGSVALAMVQLERRELVAQADAIALAVADDLSDELYYAGANSFPPSQETVVETASRMVPADVRVVHPTGVSDTAVEVTLSQTLPLAFVPDGMPLSEITVSVTSRAELRER